MKKLVSILMILGVLGVLLAGCGGGDKGADKSGAPAPVDKNTQPNGGK